MTITQRVILWCVAAATIGIILFPPICQINASDSGVTHYYFLFRLPPLDVGTFVWPLTLILMLCEWLAFALFAGVVYWIAGKFRKPKPASSPWNETQDKTPGVWPPPPKV
jgi:hypothetical protein